MGRDGLSASDPTPEAQKADRVGQAVPRVVLADDVDDVRAIVREFLDEEGIEVVAEAATGSDAIRVCLESRPDVALIDGRMPDIDGIEATREIKRRLPDTAVVLLTFYDDPQTRADAADAGVDAFLTKMGTFDELPGLIFGLCDQKAAASSSRRRG